MEFEKDLERYLVKSVEKSGGMCVKFNPDSCSGMPDRIVIRQDGQIVWVELKRRDGRLSDEQKYRHELLRRLGQDVRVVWSRDDVDVMLGMD